MERWEILTANGASTGRSIVRGKETLRQGDYHLVVHIWITDGFGNFLIQRRAEDKKLMPGEWAAIGGSAVLGEESSVAAARELYEEMGINYPANRLKYITRMTRKSSIIDIYALKSNTRASTLKLQDDEVCDAKWVTAGRLKQMVEQGEFHNYGDEYFDVIYTVTELLHN